MPKGVWLVLQTVLLRDYGKPSGMPTLVDAPCGGHAAMITDYRHGQSRVQTLTIRF